MIKPGKTKAAITTYDFPGDIKMLQNKALKALKANPQWADKYIVWLVEKGSTEIPNDLDAYGLTQGEFDKMIAGFKRRKQPIFSDTTEIVVMKLNGIITFRTSKHLDLFNYLSIDTKSYTIQFENLKTKKEILIKGKFYAPVLNGFETSSSEKSGDTKNVTGVTYFGLTIGINQGDTRPTMTLIYGKGKVGETHILSVTIL